jgi:Kyakuja-Dileera-Zisupton transposase
MIATDGNNSLKRIACVGNRAVGDVRVFDSNYPLSCDFVDGFANEVKTSQLFSDDDSNGDTEDNDGPSEGDPADGDNQLTSCADNWKAAASDDKKTMWDIFDESGCFASACRHGFMLWIANMVQSNELYQILDYDLTT